MRPACARSSNAGLRVGRSAMNTSSWTPGNSLERAHTPTALAMRPGVLRRLRDSRQRQARATLRASRPNTSGKEARIPRSRRQRTRTRSSRNARWLAVLPSRFTLRGHLDGCVVTAFLKNACAAPMPRSAHSRKSADLPACRPPDTGSAIGLARQSMSRRRARRNSRVARAEPIASRTLARSARPSAGSSYVTYRSHARPSWPPDLDRSAGR